jgi:hypothetical protein
VLLPSHLHRTCGDGTLEDEYLVPVIWSGSGGREMHIGYWWESQKEVNQWEDQDVGEWTILNWILEREDEMVWTGLIWLRIGTTGGLL